MENKLEELGIDCPDCNAFVHTPLDTVLFGNRFKCGNCSSEFLLSKTSNEQILRQLQEMNFTF